MKKNTEIIIKTDPESKLILMQDADSLLRELSDVLPDPSLGLARGESGNKDAAAIITSTAALVVASTPIISQIITGWFAQRGVILTTKADAINGQIECHAVKTK